MVVGMQFSSIVVAASSLGCTLSEVGVLGCSSACCLFIINYFTSLKSSYNYKVS